MDTMSLDDYHFRKTKLGSMKALTTMSMLLRTRKSQIAIGLVAAFSLALIPTTDADAAKRARRASGGGGGGGIVLQTPNPRTPLEHNNRGVELGGRGLWADAIREHEIALFNDPKSATFRTNLSSAHLRYGDVLQNKGDYYNAMKQYRFALYVDPLNVPADEHLDTCLQRQKKNPLDINYRRKLAEDADISGDYETAIVEYRKCVKMTDSGQDHAGLGRVLIKAGKAVDGFAEMKIAVNKDWGNNRQELGACHRQLGDLLKDYAFKAKNTGRGTIGMKRLLNAATEYKRAVTLNPSDAESVRNFVEVVREGVAIRPTFDNYLMLGGAYLLAGDFNHAQMCYEQCFKIDSRRTELAKARIAYHQAVARSPLAGPELVANSIGKVNKFIDSEPDNPQWWYILGRLKEHQNDNEGAVEAYRRAEKINPYVDPDLAQGIRRLGGQSVAMAAPGGVPGSGFSQNPSGGVPPTGGRPATAGSVPPPPAQPAQPAVNLKNLEAYSRIEKLMDSDPTEALRQADELLNSSPQDGHAYKLKGAIHEKMQQYDDAASMYRMGDALKEPGSGDALDRVDTIRVQSNVQNFENYMQQNNLVQASNELSTAITKAPRLPVLHRKMADVLRKMGDTKGADKELKKADELEKSAK